MTVRQLPTPLLPPDAETLPHRGPVPRNPPFALLALAAALLLGTSGCATTLRPFEEVRGSAPGRYVDVDGVSVHVELEGTDGPPIVLLHGFGASTWSWRELIPALASDHRVVAVDLPGFGASQRARDPEVYSRRAQVDLIVGVLDRLGLDAVHLVGHSYGGALAQNVAALAPERVRSLVLVDAAAPDYPDARRRALAGLRPLVWTFVHGVALRPLTVERILRRSFADDDLVDDALIRGYLDRLRVEGAVDAYVALTKPLDVAAPRVRPEEIRTPTLAVWGAEDVLIPPEVAREEAARFPDVRFVEIPHCGHIPQEECPEPLLREIRSFLAEAAHSPPKPDRTTISNPSAG